MLQAIQESHAISLVEDGPVAFDDILEDDTEETEADVGVKPKRVTKGAVITFMRNDEERFYPIKDDGSHEELEKKFLMSIPYFKFAGSLLSEGLIYKATPDNAYIVNVQSSHVTIRMYNTGKGVIQQSFRDRVKMCIAEEFNIDTSIIREISSPIKIGG